MRFLLLIYLSVLTTNLTAQDWFVDQYYWAYRYVDEFLGYDESTEIAYAGPDTLVGENTWHPLDQVRYYYDNSIDDFVFTRLKFFGMEDNNKIYLTNDDNEFVLTYDFNLLPGDSIVYSLIDYGCQDSIIYYLDSLSSINIGFNNYTVQHFTYKDSYSDSIGHRDVIEAIGATTGWFDIRRSHLCKENKPELELCRFWNGLQDKQFLDIDCYETSSIENNSPAQINIYPNPVYDFLNVESTTHFDKYKILNLQGKILKSNNLTQQIDTSELFAGYYIIVLEGNNTSLVLSFIKADL